MRHALSLFALLILVASPRAAVAGPAAPSGAGRTFAANGVSIWYEARGSGRGTPLVVCNGGPGFDHTYMLCSDAWDALAKSRPVVFWDQRGVGRSSPLADGTSCGFADQIADLDALRAELGVPRIDLVGHSWGAFLAMAFAARHPEAVSHLVLVASGAPRWSDTQPMFRHFYPEQVEQQERYRFLDAAGDSTAYGKAMGMTLGWRFLSGAKRDEFLAMAPRFQFRRAVAERVLAELPSIDLTPMLPQLRAPTLVLTGRFDLNVAPSTAWAIHRAIPGSRFTVLERSGHVPFFEEPEAFTRAVAAFLDEPGAK